MKCMGHAYRAMLVLQEIKLRAQVGHACMFVVLGLRTGFAAAHGGGWLGTAAERSVGVGWALASPSQ